MQDGGDVPDKIFTTLKIRDKKIKFQIDTGAQCNVISRKQMKNLNLDKHIKSSNLRLKLYDGSIMKTAGKCSLQCKKNNKTIGIDFIVVNQDTQPIIGLKTALVENFITVQDVN